MTRFHARVASADRFVLGEGPVKTGEDGVLWVDIVRGQVFLGVIEDGQVIETARHQFDGMVGAAVLADSGVLLVASQEQLVVVHTDGRRTAGPRIVPADSARRSNDGAVDPMGRFLIGTLALGDSAGGEALVRIEDDGTPTVIDDDLSLSNGIAWAPDGKVLYNTDTIPGVIWARPYDAESGRIGARHEHLRISDGFPDGICVDTDGCIWVAIWGAGEVRRFSPHGVLIDTVAVPAPHVSSVAFVGKASHQLLITTASRDLSAADLDEYPDAGRLFLADVHAKGIPTAPWSASWSSSS
ncbi:Sugar lactone lactonase YvrE [Curtobacterium sp. UNCCL20]|uniref:SMP-30/gluconolactonase/LRE family protein n=1 Tax=Curtobacterium sp. UNCCL20 TaxID=1502773 RepID=UPI0008804A5D|nr:SMP-30/gluconolactonase/LRE family protein [Curtobacterium sp. UNCCL20]SDQ92074.1 Sugar lactone lactonase YvrE [Curtobacterium sp. UNCCL20]